MITMIIKATDGCNLRCKYCSIGEKKESFHTIDINTLNKAGDYIAEKAYKKNISKIKVILHGGEPTIVDSSVYRSFFEYVLNKYNNSEWHFSIQTNGFAISESYIKLFKDFDVSVGVSIDGNERIHNMLRVDTNGIGSFERVKQNIMRLEDESILVSALIVVTKQLLGEDLSYLNFFNYNDINLKINPLLNYGEAKDKCELWLEEGDYSQYLIRVYEYMLDNEIEIKINPISDMFNSIINNMPVHDCSYRNECGKSFICVDFKGDIYPCGRFCDVYGSCMGNVFSNTDTCKYHEYPLPEQCNSCKYLTRCYGGCSAYRQIMKSETPPLCYDIKRLYDYFSNEGIEKYIEYLKEKKSILESELEIARGNCNV